MNNLAESILDAEILETPGAAMPAFYPFPPVYYPQTPAPVMQAGSHAPAPGTESSASSQTWLGPLLLAGGGVAALGMVCVLGLAILVGLAAALDGGSSGGSSGGGSGYARGGGSIEDQASSFMAESGGAYNSDLNGVGSITY